MTDINPAMTLARRVRMVDCVCVDCGSEFQAASTIAHRCIRCKECRKIRERERDLERIAEREPVKRTAQKQTMPYLVVKDPDGSWTRESRFALADIKYMLVAGYLVPGTRFRHEKRGEYEVVLVEGMQQLMRV